MSFMQFKAVPFIRKTRTFYSSPRSIIQSSRRALTSGLTEAYFITSSNATSVSLYTHYIHRVVGFISGWLLVYS